MRTVKKPFIWMASLVTTAGISFSLFAQAASWRQEIPLATPYDQARTFLKIQTLIPAMADGAVRYPFDPVMLFNHQRTINDIMTFNPMFELLAKSHQKTLEISVFDEPLKNPNGQTEQWNQLIEDSRSYLKVMELNNSQAIQKEIETLLSSPLLGKLQGITVGLAQILPPNEKKEFFAASLDAKTKLLEKYLPDEIVAHGFAPQKIGWNDTQISKSEIIHRLNQAYYLEIRLKLLMVALYDSETQKITAKEHLSKISVGNKKQYEQYFNTHIAKLIPSQTDPSTKEAALIIREVPPLVGMFRGFAGNDCSTYCSFPFVNSPNEYTFLIYDGKGGLKGYAQGTRVTAEEKSAFYLHTIAGPRLSTKDAKTIINVFDQGKTKFDFNEVLLPAALKVNGMVNFLPVREAYAQLTSKNEVPIEYPDASIRKKFKEDFKIDKNYDDPEANTIAFKLIREVLSPSLNLEVKESFDLSDVKAPYDRNFILLMLIQLYKNKAKNSSLIDELATLSSIPTDILPEISFTLENRSSLFSAQFFKEIENTLASHNFHFKPETIRKNIGLAAKGLLRSPDILTNPAFLEEVIGVLLDRREFNEAELFLTSHPEIFRNTKITLHFFRAYYNDIHEAEFKKTNILTTALKENPKAFFEQKEFLNYLSNSPSALKQINAYIDSKPFLSATLKSTDYPRITASRHDQILFRSKVYAGLMKTQTLAEYKDLLGEAKKNFPNYSEAELLHKEMLVATIDHYLSLNPRDSATTDFYSLSKYNHEVSVKRTIRKLIPSIIQHANFPVIKTFLLTFAKYRNEIEGFADIAPVIANALMYRADKAELIPQFETLFPESNFSELVAPKCEKIFMSIKL